MFHLRVGVVVAACVATVISGIILLLTFTQLPLLPNLLSGDTLQHASRTGISSSTHWLTRAPLFMLLNVGVLGALLLLTYIVMPSPWQRRVLLGAFRYRVNWVLEAARVIGVFATVSVAAVLLAGLSSGESAARSGQGYAVYRRSVMVRDIDRAEFDQISAEWEQNNNRLILRAFFVFFFINYMAIAGYGAWNLTSRQGSARP